MLGGLTARDGGGPALLSNESLQCRDVLSQSVRVQEIRCNTTTDLW